MVVTSARLNGCLFCGNENGRFDSLEHIIAKSLGNDLESGLVEEELVLPRGVVCDKCNGHRLRDGALVEWPPISIFRSLAQIRNRRGKMPDAVRGTRWHIALDPTDPTFATISVTGRTGRESRRDDVARALCKIALELRWLEDPDDARSPRWDPVAAAALGGPLPESLSFGLTLPDTPDDIDLTPEASVLATSSSEPLRLASLVCVVGLRLNLIIGTPAPPVPLTQWWILDPATGELVGPNSIWGRFSVKADSAKRLPAHTSEPPPKGSQLPTHDDQTEIRIYRARG